MCSSGPEYTDMTVSSIHQRQVVHFPYPFSLLFQILRQMHGNVVKQTVKEGVPTITVLLSACVHDDLTAMQGDGVCGHYATRYARFCGPLMVCRKRLLTSFNKVRAANHENDLWADSVMAVILQVETSPAAIRCTLSAVCCFCS